jgi:ribose/xylose/arabinose/galactoside ABC-type transport system permease subunit
MPRLTHWIEFSLDHFIWVVLMVALVAFTLAVPGYLAPSNLINILLTASILGVMVIGQALVLMTRRIDLSAEGVISLVSVIAAWLMLPYREMDLAQAGGIGWELHPFIVIPLILMLGALIGFINGFMIMKLNMNFFIVTLAMQLLLRGIAFVISQGAVMPGTPELFDILGSGRIEGIPVSILAMLLLYAVFTFIMGNTRFGRKVYAVGANEEAAQASGFSPARTVIMVYTISGLLAAISGWMLLGRVDASVPTLGAGFTLNVVAAAVIGGVSLKGGEGSIVGAFAGVLFLSMINNALNLSNVDSLWVNAIRGSIILFALIVDGLKMRYKRRSRGENFIAIVPDAKLANTSTESGD